MAERAGLSAVTVSALERGTRRSPYLGTIELLATALELDATNRAALLAAVRPSVAEARELPVANSLVPLVGRAHELTLLDQFLGGARTPRDSTAVLLLAGEPGIGKTRLLQAAAQRAVGRGWTVLVGGCQRRGGQEPYAPLLDTLSQHLQAMTAIQRRTALTGCAWLIRLLPELADDMEPLPAWAVPPEHERRLVFAAVGRFLTNVAGSAGTLLVLDDLQWAGPDALDLLDFLARTSTPLQLAGAYRDTEVSPADPLGLMLADLSRARLLQHHALGPLAEAEAADLLEDLLLDVAKQDGETVARALRQAEGTPFYLVSYAQALRQGSPDGVPWDLAQGVRQRVALLPAAGQAILGAAAAIGRRAPRTLLAAAAGEPENTVVSGLEAACRARLLLEDGDDGYVFAHDVVREIVESDVGAARRALLNRRIAEALENGAAKASPELLAYHFARAGTTERAVHYLERAGDHALTQRAHGAAETHFRAALERSELLGRTHDSARLGEKLGDVLQQSGRFADALDVWVKAAGAYHAAGDLDGLIRVTTGMGYMHSLRGSREEELALLTGLLDRVALDNDSAPAHAMLTYVRGQIFVSKGDLLAALVSYERAAELARASSDTHAMRLAGGQCVNLLQMLGRLDEALRVGDDILPLFNEASHIDTAILLRDLAYIHVLQGDFATSGRLMDRSFDLIASSGNPFEHSLILMMRGWLAALTGDRQRAHADLNQALASCRQDDWTWYSPYPSAFHARLSLAEGDWATALTAARQALTQVGNDEDRQALRMASGVIAEIDILEDRAEAALARLIPLLDLPGMHECEVTLFLPVLAWAQLDLGHVDLAEDTLSQALARARSGSMRLVLVEALRVGGLIALHRADWSKAAQCLGEGLAHARAMPYPYAEARLLYLDGQLHEEQEEPRIARERIEAARAIFARLDARQDLNRVEQDLNMVGQTTPR